MHTRFAHAGASDARAPEMLERYGARVFFETPEADALGGAVPPTPQADFQPEPAPQSPAAPPPAAEAPPAAPQAGLSEEQIRELFGQVLDERLAQAGPEYGPPQGAPPQTPQPDLPQWDPYDPQTVMTYMDRMLEQRMGQITPQLQGFGEIADYVAEREAQHELDSTWDALARPEGEGGIGGDFNREMARARAEAYVEASNMPVDRALERAARDQRTYEEELRRQGAEAYMEQARTLRDGGGPDPVGPGQPPAAPAPSNDPREQAREDLKAGRDPFKEALTRSMERHGVTA